MANEPKVHELSADKPIENLSQDRLGFAPFAQHLGRSIERAKTSDGYVIAVHGVWGSGKTSLLNLMRKYFEGRGDDGPVVLTFNPWWFSGQDLTIRFFREIGAAMGEKGGWDAAREKLADFGEMVAPPLAHIPYIGAIGISLNKVSEVLRSKKTTEQVKSELAEKLREHPKKLVVVIDDIDRLSSEEVRELFQLLKAVADLPNVVYVLAFDRSLVTRALEEVQDGTGEDYLEKIVQASFELPIPEPGSIQELFIERLLPIIADVPNEAFDQVYWANTFRDGIRHFIKTPRQVTLLSNALGLTFSAVEGEVYTIDFIALETLRLFCRPVYEAIRSNGAMFTGISDGIADYEKNALLDFHNSWLSSLDEDEREPVKAIVLHLFPKLKWVWGNTLYGWDWAQTWRKDLRVASPEIFPVYFRLGVPANSVSAGEIADLLAALEE